MLQTHDIRQLWVKQKYKDNVFAFSLLKKSALFLKISDARTVTTLTMADGAAKLN